ncbi:MAG: ImmA/IrrE family metallo-endopeptidase [Bacteroidales bacterium]|nr:ImmA/IrrE family metallo-endopeptidase [Bacteroidales bacterium]
MMKTTDLRAARKFGPGYFIREQMELRQWTQEDMASVLGVTIKHVNKILTEKQPITLEMARIFAEVFNTSAQYWINHDTGYRLWLQQEKSQKEKEADIKAKIYERMPINDMIKKGWLPKCTSVKELEKNVLEFWNLKELDFSGLGKQLPCLTKKSDAYNQFNDWYALTWYQMARKVALERKMNEYNKQNVTKLYNGLHKFTVLHNGINKFLSQLSDCGVNFLILPHLQKTYLDGAAFLLNNTPVIVYTARYKRIDNFWFTVAHEVAHVLKHLNDETTLIFDDFKNGKRTQMEYEANQLAAEKLKHNEILQYLKPYLNYLTSAKVEECAAKYEVHESIIVGKLAHDEVISYRNQTLFNENVLKLIDEKYIAKPII